MTVTWRGWRRLPALCWLVGVAACEAEHTLGDLDADTGGESGEDAPSAGGGMAGRSGAVGHAGQGVLPPFAQGAMRVQLTSPNAPILGKMCPSGASQSFDVPAIADDMVQDTLSESVYVHKVVAGEDGAVVSCRVVKTATGFDFAGVIQLGGKMLSLTNGTLAGGEGTAHVEVSNSQILSGSLSSPGANCTIDVSGQSLQVATGAMWATFACASVEHAPSDYCGAKGIFVLENCSRE